MGKFHVHAAVQRSNSTICRIYLPKLHCIHSSANTSPYNVQEISINGGGCVKTLIEVAHEAAREETSSKGTQIPNNEATSFTWNLDQSVWS